MEDVRVRLKWVFVGTVKEFREWLKRELINEVYGKEFVEFSDEFVAK